MKFILEIELGNEAMQSFDDLADALTQVQQQLYRSEEQTQALPMDGESGTIRDINGNTVGKWEVI